MNLGGPRWTLVDLGEPGWTGLVQQLHVVATQARVLHQNCSFSRTFPGWTAGAKQRSNNVFSLHTPDIACD